MRTVDVLIVGAGPAGLAAAGELKQQGVDRVLAVEREEYAGGVLMQCIQPGFGLHLWNEELTGPEYAERFLERALELDARIMTRSAVLDLRPRDGGCDTLLLSAGLVPENELSLRAGLTLDPATGGPVVDSRYQTSIPGIFACGNVLHVHDVADFVSLEAEAAALAACRYLSGAPLPPAGVSLRAGNLVRYVLPVRVDTTEPFTLCLRPLAPLEDTTLCLRLEQTVLFRRRFRTIRPGTMIRLTAEELALDSASLASGSVIKVYFSREAV